MDENGVTISFKEIYDEQKKTNQALLELTATVNNLSSRMDKIERRMDEKEGRKSDTHRDLKVALMSISAPIVFYVIYLFVQSGGVNVG